MSKAKAYIYNIAAGSCGRSKLYEVGFGVSAIACLVSVAPVNHSLAIAAVVGVASGCATGFVAENAIRHYDLGNNEDDIGPFAQQNCRRLGAGMTAAFALTCALSVNGSADRLTEIFQSNKLFQTTTTPTIPSFNVKPSGKDCVIFIGKDGQSARLLGGDCTLTKK